jgi:hypothetical protein
MEDLVKKLGEEVKAQKKTWKEASVEFNKETGIEITGNALRKRHSRLIKRKDNPKIQKGSEYETYFGNGEVEARKIVNLPPKIKDNPDLVVRELGYNPDEWEIIFMTFSNWQQHTKEQTTKELYAVKFKMKPATKELVLEDYVNVAKEVFKKEIKPITLPKKKQQKELNKELLIECPGIELHLGKLGWHGETGENYDYKIASERFNKIIREIIATQNVAKVGNLFMSIGNDFFNTDTINYTTTKGTPQSNDIRWKKMFLIGLELYKNALIELRKHFNKIDLNLVQGNHDEMVSFYLYIALGQFFQNDNIISFSDDLKETQCYKFGKNAIFTNHGDKNLKRLIKSIPAEFYEEWGTSLYRELHLGHLHKEVVVDDESGLITRRVGSPSGNDEWHYSERFVGATPRHQLFLWHKEKGLLMNRYITFESKKKSENEKILKR